VQLKFDFKRLVHVQQGLKFAYTFFVVIKFKFFLNQFIMNDFRQYEEAIALYHNKLSINTAPVYSWIFIMISCVLSRTF
jgi:hypothetical protein